MDEVVIVHIINNSSKGVKEKYNNYKKEERRERKKYIVHGIVEENCFIPSFADICVNMTPIAS